MSAHDRGLDHEVDPAIAEHVITIRNRFGMAGLHDAKALIEMEIAIFADAMQELAKD